MFTEKVACEVLGEEGVFGEFANAVRVLLDGDDYLLDFCVYSPRERKARLVSRVRIHRSFLPLVSARLSEEAGEMTYGQGESLEFKDGFLQKGGKLILLVPPEGTEDN